MKLVNPLHYPLAILAGGITLVVGVRLMQLPSYVSLPSAAAIALGLAIPLNQKEAQRIKLDNPALAGEIKSVKQQSQLLTKKSQELRSEAKQLLTSATQLELLATIEYACDRVLELPTKIDRLAQKLQGSDSLLSPEKLAEQLAEVEAKATQSSGVAQQHLNQLANSLANNLQLAQEGDKRESDPCSFCANLSILVGNSKTRSQAYSIAASSSNCVAEVNSCLASLRNSWAFLVNN